MNGTKIEYEKLKDRISFAFQSPSGLLLSFHVPSHLSSGTRVSIRSCPCHLRSVVPPGRCAAYVERWETESETRSVANREMKKDEHNH